MICGQKGYYRMTLCSRIFFIAKFTLSRFRIACSPMCRYNLYSRLILAITALNCVVLILYLSHRGLHHVNYLFIDLLKFIRSIKSFALLVWAIDAYSDIISSIFIESVHEAGEQYSVRFRKGLLNFDFVEVLWLWCRGEFSLVLYLSSWLSTHTW